MTEGAKDRFRQPCLLPQLFKHLSDNPIPAGPTIGQRRQIVVLISVAEKPPEVHPVRLSVPAKCKPGFSATSPTLYRAVSGLSADNGEFADCP